MMAIDAVLLLVAGGNLPADDLIKKASRELAHMRDALKPFARADRARNGGRLFYRHTLTSEDFARASSALKGS